MSGLDTPTPPEGTDETVGASADGMVAGSGRAGPGRWIALAVGVVIIGFIGVLATGLGGDDRDVRSDHLLDRRAPELSGTTLDGDSFDGPVFALDSLRGRWVAVNFFATWCVPCIQEHPELAEWSGRHEDRSLVSVVFDDEPDDVAAFFDEHGGDWPVIDAGSAGVAYGVLAVPETVIVAPSGVVVGRFTGAVTADDLDRFIDAFEDAAGPVGPTVENGSGS
ncbi:MAG: TlpA disulfide reductase family protein [Actinomycetota bacterium]|nr:TlpA disulfide reductase family protein [Actinomycetota bacterium]